MTQTNEHVPEVELAADHPGFRDPEYRARRNQVARLARRHVPGTAPPAIDYTAAEHATWARVCAVLAPLHRRLACRELLAAQRHFELPNDRIPQLAELGPRLQRATGFRLEPVAGLVEIRQFLGRLADRVFLATQYVRHPAQPFYTPEPDVVHELVGHAASLAEPRIAQWNREFGRAARVADAAELTVLGRVYWHTLEFGAVTERAGVRAFGAGLLSSCDEIRRLDGDAHLAEWDLDRMACTPYDPQCLQPRYFVAPSFARLDRNLLAWLRDGGWRSRR